MKLVIWRNDSQRQLCDSLCDIDSIYSLAVLNCVQVLLSNRKHTISQCSDSYRTSSSAVLNCVQIPLLSNRKLTISQSSDSCRYLLRPSWTVCKCYCQTENIWFHNVASLVWYLVPLRSAVVWLCNVLRKNSTSTLWEKEDWTFGLDYWTFVLCSNCM